LFEDVGRIAIVLGMFIDRTSKDGVMIQISYHIFTEFGAALITVSEQSYKGKVKTHKYINRQNQSTTEKL
jgi:hypothetical protein